MLVKVLTREIMRGKMDGIPEKLDIFLASGKLTIAEYTTLMELYEERHGA